MRLKVSRFKLRGSDQYLCSPALLSPFFVLGGGSAKREAIPLWNSSSGVRLLHLSYNLLQAVSYIPTVATSAAENNVAAPPAEESHKLAGNSKKTLLDKQASTASAAGVFNQ